MQKYAVVEKAVGETPLQALERFRALHGELDQIPMAYAGRLDPMASGKLLILIGEECKQQERYHALDKEYEFEVLFGIGSDTGDVLGRLSFGDAPQINEADLCKIARTLSRATLSLPYPKFSARTVQGKPLHTWTLEGRLDEIEIPTATTHIHKLTLESIRTVQSETIYNEVAEKIETIPEVTDERKRLGADFRRADVRADWQEFAIEFLCKEFTIAKFRCIASSGTYMRSLAEHIGKEMGTSALAYSIHRTTVGRYLLLPFGLGIWKKRY